MATDTTLLGADVVKFDSHQDGLNPVFRAVIDCGKTPIATGTDYALFKFPVGFAPRTAYLYVREDVAAAGTNYDFDLNIGVATDTDSVKTVALDDVDAAGDFAVASLFDGTVASSTATLAPVVVAADGVYGWLKSDQAVTKGVIEVVVAGDQLLTPAKAF